MESKMPPLQFVAGVAHIAVLGPNVILSLAGYEHGSGADGSFPITHRLVMSREGLEQSVKFLQEWLAAGQGAGSPPSASPLQ